MRLKLVFLILFLIFSFSIITISNAYKSNVINKALKEPLIALNTHYDIITYSYKLTANAIFHALYSNSAIVDVLSKAQTASMQEKNILRKKLLNSLNFDYDSLRPYGINLVLITESNNRVFLRIHKPEIFGDDISQHRKAVALVNKTHKITHGFEKGKISHAFRNIFPIFDQKNNYLGNIDISFSSDNLQKTMDKLHKIHTHFLVKRSIIDSRVWEVNDVASPYKNSLLSDEYLISKYTYETNHPHKEIFQKIITNNLSFIQSSIQNSKQFVINGDHGFTDYIIAFQPIHSIVSNTGADAYIVSFSHNKEITKVETGFFYFNIFTILLVAIIISLIYYLYIKNLNLKNQAKSLESINEELQTTTNRLDKAQQISRTGSWEWNLQTNEAFWSKTLYQIYGYDNSKKPDPNILISQVHPDDKEQHIANIENSLKNGIYHDEYRILREPDKKVYYLYATGEVVYDNENKPLIHHGTVMDISEKKHKDEMLINQSRQAAMGDMIAMIAHQWRQPITVIGMEANNIRVDIELEEEITTEKLKKMVDSISEQTQQLSQTIDDFRDFFKPNQIKVQTTVNSVIEGTLKIVGKSLENNNITVTIENRSDTELITYSNQLLHVFLNLLGNAKDILIDKKIPNAKITITVDETQDSIVTKICDNGGGIPKDAIKRLGEPYFTTKEKNGTGLGLYMSIIIVKKQLNGSLRWENEDEGACFIVTLPKR